MTTLDEKKFIEHGRLIASHMDMADLIFRAMNVQPHTPVHKLIDSIIHWSDRPATRKDYETMTNEMIKDKFRKWLTIHETSRVSG